MKVIAYTRPDGGVSIVVPAREGVKALAKSESRAVPVGAERVVIDSSEIPSDRTFRNAFRLNSGKVEVDMPEARKIHLSRLRELRDQKLREKDVEWSRALAKGETADAQAVEDDRQALRDLPPKAMAAMRAIETPDDLKIYIPVELS